MIFWYNILRNKNEWVEVRKSKIHNRGVFAKKNIPKGTYMVEYLGRKIANKRANEISEKETKKRVLYLFGLNKRYSIDGNNWYNPAKYINHACEVNAESINDKGHIWFVAKKNIKKSEEILYDYCLETDDPKDHPCNCNFKTCKGLMVQIKKRKKVT